VFAHFDPDDRIDDYVLRYVEALNALGAEIIFCTASENVPESEIDKLRPLCQSIVVRRNIGYDFASYRTGLQEAGDLSRYDSVILANDSVYGPLTDLKAVFAAMSDKGADFWGITDSLQYVRHLQTYFLVFGKRVATSDAFRDFWRTFPNCSGKISAVTRGELGMSGSLTDAGFKMGALCETRRIRSENSDVFEARRSPYLLVRPTQFDLTYTDWRLLIERYGCPFIKVRLLRTRPEFVPDVSDWESVVRGNSDYDPSLVHNHLRRIGRT
jgi:rhamnosyltransferase